MIWDHPERSSPLSTRGRESPRHEDTLPRVTTGPFTSHLSPGAPMPLQDPGPSSMRRHSLGRAQDRQTRTVVHIFPSRPHSVTSTGPWVPEGPFHVLRNPAPSLCPSSSALLPHASLRLAAPTLPHLSLPPSKSPPTLIPVPLPGSPQSELPPPTSTHPHCLCYDCDQP